MVDRSANEIVAAAHSVMRDKARERLLVEFAAAALTGLLAMYGHPEKSSGQPDARMTARSAYAYADAMLSEWERRAAARKETAQ